MIIHPTITHIYQHIMLAWQRSSLKEDSSIRRAISIRSICLSLDCRRANKSWKFLKFYRFFKLSDSYSANNFEYSCLLIWISFESRLALEGCLKDIGLVC